MSLVHRFEHQAHRDMFRFLLFKVAGFQFAAVSVCLRGAESYLS